MLVCAVVVAIAVAGVGVWLALGSKPATPTVHTRTATVGQYAAVLGRFVDQYQAAATMWQDDCGSSGGDDATGCVLDVGQLSVAAHLLQAQIRAVGSPTSTEYLGSPPASIASLVSSTGIDAGAVWTDTQPPSSPKAGWQDAARLLYSDCVAWAPYVD